MYKEVLTSIDAVAIFPIISFVIFFSFFTFLLIQVWRSDKALMEKMSAVPVDKPIDDINNTVSNKDNKTL